MNMPPEPAQTPANPTPNHSWQCRRGDQTLALVICSLAAKPLLSCDPLLLDLLICERGEGWKRMISAVSVLCCNVIQWAEKRDLQPMTRFFFLYLEGQHKRSQQLQPLLLPVPSSCALDVPAPPSPSGRGRLAMKPLPSPRQLGVLRSSELWSGSQKVEGEWLCHWLFGCGLFHPLSFFP